MACRGIGEAQSSTSSTYVCDEPGKQTKFAVEFKLLYWECSDVRIECLSGCSKVANKVHKFIEQL
jgi:hypothetical protein